MQVTMTKAAAKPFYKAMITLENAVEHLNDLDRPLGMFDAYRDAENILNAAFYCVGTRFTVYVRQQTNGRVVAYRG
jgi:hypothetical protein